MSVIVSDYSEGKEKSIDKGLVEVLKAKIDLPCPHIRRWVCLCAGKLWTSSENAKAAALSEKVRFDQWTVQNVHRLGDSPDLTRHGLEHNLPLWRISRDFAEYFSFRSAAARAGGRREACVVPTTHTAAP